MAMEEKKAAKGRCNPEQRRRYYEQNIQRERQCSKAYRERNGDHYKAYQRKYRAANRERAKEYQRKYRAANRVRIANTSRKYYIVSKDQIAEATKYIHRRKNENMADNTITHCGITRAMRVGEGRRLSGSRTESVSRSTNGSTGQRTGTR